MKGVLTREDAALACEHGAAGIVVSNHGGRQLDGVSATIDALPEVVEAVAGRSTGAGRRRRSPRDGCREGARARRAKPSSRAEPRCGAWPSAGEAGARHVLELLRDEILLALKLVGATSPADVSRTAVQRIATQ